MIRDDLLLRLIQRAAQAIAKAMGLATQGLDDESHVVLDAAARSLVGLELDLAEALPPESVLDLLGGVDAPEPARLIALSQLLGARGELLAREGHPARASACLLRATELGSRAAQARVLLPEDSATVGEEVERLARLLKAQSLPEALLRRLAALAEANGRLADAEDWLGVLLDANAEGADAIALAFYGRLSTLKDATLQAGGLSRGEVEEAAARLHRVA